MCVLFGSNAKAIFADTGWEHAEMYERIDSVESEVKKLHPSFELIRIKNTKHESLKKYIETQKFYPSIMARYCTRLFKIEPIDDFLKSKGKCELMIGFNASEKDRIGNHGLLSNVSYTYPLIEHGLSRDRCLQILEYANLKPDFPPYMRRGGCVGCFYKSKKEFKALLHLSPNEYNEVEEIEKSIQDKRNAFYSIRDGIDSFELLRKSEEKLLFDANELYDSYESLNTPCGAFCHR